MLKLNKNIVRIAYLVFVAAWVIGDFKNNINDDFKYIFMVAATVVPLVIVIYNLVVLKKKIDTSQIFQMVIIWVTFFFLSLVAMFFNGFKLACFKDLFYMAVPVLMAFGITNTDSEGNLDFYMITSFFGTVAYFIYRFYDKFTIANILSISFKDSFSPFETTLADIFLIAFVYFYVRKKPVFATIAFILNFITFKRIHVVFSLAFVLFGWALKKVKLSDGWLRFTKIMLILSPILISIAVSDWFEVWFEDTLRMDFNKFTMGRFEQIKDVLAGDFSTFGLGIISNHYVEQGASVKILHCDLLRITLETTVIGLVMFVNSYFNLVKKNIYGYVLLLFFFIIMFSSTCIHMPYTWLLIYLAIEGFKREQSANDDEEKRIGDSTDVQLMQNA